ncbi:MAG: TlpA family protein disulfide reductase [Nitrospinota bacterium]|nr:TlpA family protein disulfide reductase [Nitrospinota bacterium]MDH5757418.1 TlpA family protein disulfide reductase [Nitrospinota bacterium]
MSQGGAIHQLARRLLAPGAMALLMIVGNAGATEETEMVDAPAFHLQKPGGGHIGSADITGKVALLNFWATWCVPCVQEIPHLDRMFGKYQEQGFVIIGVNYQQDEPRIIRFMEKRPVSYPMAMDPDGALSKHFGVRALPVSILIDREGVIVEKLVGTLTVKVLEAWLDRYLAK